MIRRAAALGVALATACVTVAITAATPAHAASAAPAGCAAKLFITARGTGMKPGTDTVILDAVAARLKPVGVVRWDLPYAATTDYPSAGDGGRLLADVLRKQAAACPTQKIALGGYSQGAIVIQFALTSGLPASVTNHVAAIATFGNAFHEPGKAFDAGDAKDKTGPDALFIRSALDSFPLRARDYCRSNDSACGGFGLDGHTQYGVYAANAAGFVAAKFTGKAAPGVPTTAPAPPAAPNPFQSIIDQLLAFLK